MYQKYYWTSIKSNIDEEKKVYWRSIKCKYWWRKKVQKRKGEKGPKPFQELTGSKIRKTKLISSKVFINFKMYIIPPIKIMKVKT